MKFIKKSESVRHANSDNCIAHEYPFGDLNINIAFVEVKNRYPDFGKVFNEKCTELVFVVEGNGKVFVNGEELILERGDSVLIEPKEVIYWEGDLKLLIACNPAWTLEQYNSID